MNNIPRWCWHLIGGIFVVLFLLIVVAIAKFHISLGPEGLNAGQGLIK